MSRLLTLQDCAERTGTSLRWWRRAVFEKRLPVIKLGRLVRIDERDLEAFIDGGRVEPERERGGKSPHPTGPQPVRRPDQSSYCLGVVVGRGGHART